MDTCTRRQIDSHTDTYRQGHSLSNGPGFLCFPKFCQMRDRIKKTHRDSRNLNIESRFRPITVFTWTGHEVEVQTQRKNKQETGRSLPRMQSDVPKILCSNLLPRRSGRLRFFFLFCAWHTASTETEFVSVCVAL